MSIIMRIVISGGGSSGHINPAISVGDCIKRVEPNSEILYIGTDSKLEKELYGKTGEKYKLYTAKGISRKKPLSNFNVLITNLRSYKKMKADIKEFKPDIGFSTGGYISAIAMTALRNEKKPFIIHEQNAYPGLTTRMLSKHAKKYALAFMEANKYLKNKALAVLTGNPIRNECLTITKEKARQKLGFSKEEKIIVCFGGSNGAGRLNEIFTELAKVNYNEQKYRLIIGTGARYYNETIAKLNGLDLEKNKIHIKEYINNMPEILAASDLAITRSGAMTISELAAMNKPSILIPSPNVTADHQTPNAELMAAAGGAIKINENDLSLSLISKEIDAVINDESKLKKMSDSLEKIAVRDADMRIYRIIKDVQIS